MRSLTCVSLAIVVAACGDRSRSRPADSTVVPVDSPRAPDAATAMALPLRALGTEPFWALDVDSTGLRFITPDDTSGIRFPPAAPSAIGDNVVWMGETDRAAIAVRIWPGRCSDGMSDRVYAYAAIVRLSGTEYRGCAARLPLNP
jgi:uncharacterized membrane protein